MLEIYPYVTDEKERIIFIWTIFRQVVGSKQVVKRINLLFIKIKQFIF